LQFESSVETRKSAIIANINKASLDARLEVFEENYTHFCS